VCLHHDGKPDERWSAEGCKTTYINSELAPKIRCTCTTLHDYYYAVITDRTIVPSLPRSTRKALIKAEKQDSASTYILLAIVLPLVLIGILMPCLLAKLDGIDYKKLEENAFNVDALTSAKF